MYRAEQLLSGNIDAAQGNSARLAAVLARQALETIVLQRCKSFGAEVEYASMRSRLVILRAFDDPSAANDAAGAWQGLSAVCHRHAFELSPTVSEVRSQCEVVARLL
ncbi:MAG: hypothetical protein JHC79_20655 [Williamsia sp.]|nr:hypothetical protein [Williamsia sp.]